MFNKITENQIVYLHGDDTILRGLGSHVKDDKYVVCVGNYDYHKLRENLYLSLDDAIFAWIEKTRLVGGIYRAVEEVRVGDTIYMPMLDNNKWVPEAFIVSTIFLYKDSFGDTNIRIMTEGEGYYYDEPEYVFRAEVFTSVEACEARCKEKDNE